MQLYYKQIALGNKTLGGNCNSSIIMVNSILEGGSWNAYVLLQEGSTH